MQTDKSRAVAHYEALAAQAQMRALTIEASIGRDVFLSELQGGRDSLFRVSLWGRAYRLSTFLGQCDRHAQALLFSACHAALTDAPAEQVKAKLAEFAQAVAVEYGQDSEECWTDAADEVDPK